MCEKIEVKHLGLMVRISTAKSVKNGVDYTSRRLLFGFIPDSPGCFLLLVRRRLS